MSQRFEANGFILQTAWSYAKHPIEMCKVHHTVGSLKFVESHLMQNGIRDYGSMEDLLRFQKEYEGERERILAEHARSIDEERKTLVNEVAGLNEWIDSRRTEVAAILRSEIEALRCRLDDDKVVHSDGAGAIVRWFQNMTIKARIAINESSFKRRLNGSLRKASHELSRKNKRMSFINERFDEAVAQSASSRLEALDGKKRAIDEIAPSIHGAIGELRVVEELMGLSDDHILINDFKLGFNPPIRYRGEDFIMSIQVDHVVVSPAGIFVIETKNWGEQTVNDEKMFSPIRQIDRAGYAMYRVISGRFAKSGFRLFNHHWGERKIPVRNMVVFTNKKPVEGFHHVKVLSLKELTRYIDYFMPVFTSEQTEEMAGYLLEINGT
jgi:hypothetical protein